MKQMPNVLILPILLIVAFSGCSSGKSPSVSILYKDYLAQKDIKNEKYEEALAKYYSLLEDDGERAATHSNIGVILNSIQKSEDSLKSLQHALKLAEAQGDEEMIFKVRYNLGVYYGALKKIPEALDNYQAALDILPDSHEIKTNIELLMQQQQQKQKEQSGQSEQNQDKSKSGQEENKDDKPGNEPKDQKDSKDPKDENKEQKDGKDEQKKESSPKYQPRPFKGDQLSEGDVKKILGELKNQEQKIRANFEKKEKGKSRKNEKDW